MSKKLDAPYKSGPSKAWLKNQKSECTCRNSGNRWDLLINASLAMAAVALTRHSLANGISDAKVGRIMRHPQAHEDQPWFWTITATLWPHTSGTLDVAI